MENTALHPQTDSPTSGTRAADAVVAALEERIYSGQLKDGQMLPAERELIEEFGVSRTVAREAVKILGGKGLIEARPRHRPVVRQPDFETALGVLGGLVNHLIGQSGGVKHLFDTRIFVEAGLVRSAALDASKDDIANLRTALEHNRDCIDDSAQFYETDMAFHAVLYTIPRNPIFPALHRSFCEWLEGRWRQMPRLSERNARNFAAHQAIFDAILNRDPDTAERALRTHLADSWTQVRNTFGDL